MITVSLFVQRIRQSAQQKKYEGKFWKYSFKCEVTTLVFILNKQLFYPEKKLPPNILQLF